MVAKQSKSLGWKIGAGVVAGLVVGGLAFGIGCDDSAEVDAQVSKIAELNEQLAVKPLEVPVEVYVENETKILELQAELGVALEQVAEFEPLALEGNFKAVLKDLALEELEDEREEVADFLYAEFGYVLDEDDIKFRDIEEWQFSYDADDLVDEDIEDVDATIWVEMELKGEDELTDDNFKEDVKVKFEYDNGKMRLKEIVVN